MCAAVGHDVVQLARVRIGAFDLADLPVGQWRRLRQDEVRLLMRGRSAAVSPPRLH
jgi:16S rRNA U516 pseudouridylate synthase RsuA-like enzyme